MITTVLDDSEHEKKVKILREIRLERYGAQSIAKIALPNERVSICLRRILGSNVQVMRHLKTEKTFYNGLMVCGSVWTCPVCAAKISEKRKNELKTALDIHKKSGGQVALLTLTFSHKRSDDLDAILERFNKATKSFMGGRQFNQLRQLMGIIGRVKVIELTYGETNGFHPHSHIAIFYENEVDLEYVKNEMFKLWQRACKNQGLETKKKYGLDLQGAEEVAAYLNKHGNWNLEQEMTKAHIKKGKKGSLTPFDFLRSYIETEDEKYLKLFRSYAKTFKGKRQVHWSRGLKDHFGILDKSDEQIAKEKVEHAEHLGDLSPADWRKILRKEQRAQLLSNIETYGFDAGVAITLQN